jgi:hypothetical protein
MHSPNKGLRCLFSVLGSGRAIQVNIEIMRAFVRLRQILASHAELARKVEALALQNQSAVRLGFVLPLESYSMRKR